MVKLELGYIAGIFDADGTVYIYNSGRKCKRINRGISISNWSSKSLDLCRAIKETMGYGNIYDLPNGGHKYMVTRKSFIGDFCSRVGPYSFIKQRQYNLMQQSCNLIFGSSKGNKYFETKKINNSILDELKKEKNNNETIVYSSPPDFQWFAGMLDGDGCLVYSRAFKEDRRYPYYIRRSSIVVMDESFASFLAEHVDGRVRVDKHPSKKTPLVSLEISDKKSLFNFLDSVFPYLFLKKEKASLLLSGLCINPTVKGVCNNNIYSDDERWYLEYLCKCFSENKV